MAESAAAVQQLLLLLHHASMCQSDTCPVAHCSASKNLLAHASTCSEPRCPVTCCISSRMLLSHCSQCNDAHCVVCGPVRHALLTKVVHDDDDDGDGDDGDGDGDGDDMYFLPDLPPQAWTDFHDGMRDLANFFREMESDEIDGSSGGGGDFSSGNA